MRPDRFDEAISEQLRSPFSYESISPGSVIRNSARRFEKIVIEMIDKKRGRRRKRGPRGKK